ncbi:hypothetical protein NG800_011535 [Epilithonimonas ginsengisoli]|uniref:Uncharacterized protein n=1 Tax=Epilithonimonas ginsengisoli TaxID=1245592 RepID=A0ABU4JIN3_9FLAO|nr:MULTISPECIES: hypothetical protein [Chryseobacterium group]MBV6879111.1 hypothetical protein [Epilithonimonas sp. FP105]MDW8549545.1 hypothetical protein [Epilithonimonas ginsengisoli]OAH74407.1 hypothetical protein AXA65_06515 [Chryseobacterium sp. FP211-J200]
MTTDEIKKEIEKAMRPLQEKINQLSLKSDPKLLEKDPVTDDFKDEQNRAKDQWKNDGNEFFEKGQSALDRAINNYIQGNDSLVGKKL